MREGRTFRATAAVLALALSAIVLTGCEPEDKELAVDFMTSYFTRKIDPSEIGIAAVGNLLGALSGRGGDPEVNAALAAHTVIENIGKADALAAEADTLWAQGKADVLYVADAFAVMEKDNQLLG